MVDKMKMVNINELKTFLLRQCEKSRQYVTPYNRIGKKVMVFDMDDLEEFVNLIKYIAEDEKYEQYKVSIKQ